MQGKNILFKNSSLYIFGNLLNKSIPFAMLPFLTKFLSVESYGYISIFTAAGGILIALVSLSTPAFINTHHFLDSRDDMSKYISNSIFLSTISSFFLLLLIYLLSISGVQLLLSQEWLYFLVLYLFSNNLIEIQLSLFRARELAKKYVTLEVIRTILNFLISFLLIYYSKLDWKGRVLGIGLAPSITVAFCLVPLLRKISIKHIEKKIALQIAVFSLPLIPHIISGWVMTSSDRFFIVKYTNLDETGLYTVAYQISLILGILAVSFNNAWQPFLFNRLKNPDSFLKRKIVKFTYIYFIAIILITYILIVIAPYVFKYFLNPSYSKALIFVPPLVLSYAFNGMYYMTSSYLFFTKNTKHIMVSTITGATLNIVLNSIFIPRYGAVSAAYTTCISYFIIFILSWYFSSKVYDMPWNIFRHYE